MGASGDPPVQAEGGQRIGDHADHHDDTEGRTVRSPLSTGARNVIEYSDPSGEYADLRKWMKQRRLL